MSSSSMSRDGEEPWQLDIEKFKPPQNPNARSGCLNQHLGKAKKVREYYEVQEEICNGFSEMEKLNGPIARWTPGTTQGILVFSVIMVTLGLQVIIESVRNLLSSGPYTTDQLHGAKFPWVVSIMTGSSVLKLGLTFYCWSSRHHIVRTFGDDDISGL